MPDCSVTQNLAGKTAQEIFSTDLFIQEIKHSADQLQIDTSSVEEKSLPLYLDTCLQSKTPEIHAKAHAILKLFGERLAVILLCLKEGSRENRRARIDWSDSHWDYWNSLNQVILVGGLANSLLGESLKHYVEKVFSLSNKKPYHIILGNDSTYAGLKGCATYLNDCSDSQVNLIFDYGQSFVKRSYAITQNQHLHDIVILDKILSKHVEWDIKDPETEEKEAVLLNKCFLETITSTIRDVEQQGLSIHPHIVISIANYVKDGAIANRGGYGKLRLIAPNYAEYLSTYLKEKENRDFQFSLVHDGTAMAFGYSHYQQAVCVSLGTAFGIGYPS